MTAFKTGSLAWAKLGNYPPWPARITSLELVDKDVRPQLKTSWGPDDKLCYFFGSHNHAWISQNSLWTFEDHYDDYHKLKKPSKAFALALREIEKFRKTGKIDTGDSESEHSDDSSESEQADEKSKDEKDREKQRKAQEREKKKQEQEHRRQEKLRKSEEKSRREQEARETIKTPKKDKKADADKGKRKRAEESDDDKRGPHSSDESTLPSKKRKIRDALVSSATPDSSTWKKPKVEGDQSNDATSKKSKKSSTPSTKKESRDSGPGGSALSPSTSSSSSDSPPPDRASSAHHHVPDGAVSSTTASTPLSDSKTHVVFPLPPLANGKPVGKDHIDRCINSLVRHPIAKYLKFSIDTHTKGAATARASFSDARNANKMEVHPCIASVHFLLDTMAYAAIIESLKEGEAAFTQAINVTALRPIPPGNEFSLKASLTLSRNKMFFVDAEAHFKGERCFVAQVIKSVQDEPQVPPESPRPDGKPKQPGPSSSDLPL